MDFYSFVSSPRWKIPTGNFFNNVHDEIGCKIMLVSEMKKYQGDKIFSIYDPKNLFLDKKLKGGLTTDEYKI